MGLRRFVAGSLVVLMLLAVVACGDAGVGESPTANPAERDRVAESTVSPTMQPTEPEPAPTQIPVIAPPTSNPLNLDPDGDGWYTAAEFQIALDNEASTMEFAPDYPMTGEQAWDNFRAGTDPSDSEFQIGLEHTILSGYRECGWMLTWLVAYTSGDPETQQIALTHLGVMVEPGYLGDQGSLDIVTSMLGQAQLGD
ncbi:MAG: hypothetical protein M9950_09480, partial [Thermomicrobiales bacterium]|nr:hypothetical protein [Thermomicrobiales bacterium]